MKVDIAIKEWKMKEDDGIRKIAGSYAIKAGAAEIANQTFNEYGGTTLVFSAELMVEIEAISEKIKAEVIENLVGKEG